MANNLENIIRRNADKATKAVTGAKPNVNKASGKQVQKSSANKPKQKKKEQKKEEKKPTWSEYASAQLNKSSGGRTHTSTTRPAQRQNVNTQGVDKNNPVLNALQYSAKRRAKDFVDLVGSAEKAQAQDDVVYSGSGRFKHKVTKQNLNAMSEKDRNEFKRNKIRQQTQAFRTEQTSKQIDKSMEKDLKQGAKNFTKDTVFKADYVPVVSDVMKYQAKKNAKTQKQQLKDSYTTEKGNIDKWVEDLRAEGVDVDHPENKAIIEQTYADLDKWYKDSKKDVNKEVKNSGKIDLSGRDIYKGGVKMVDEMADYAIPYGATSKTALKGAEKLMVKGAKAVGVKTSKEASKDFAEKQIRKAAMGKITEKAAQRNINLYNSARGAVSNTAKELTANAMQDATIGTGIDYAKAKQQGLKGEQLKDYMLTSAAMNAVFGIPMTAVAGRAGAKEFKNQLGQSAVEGGNKAVADAVKLSKQEAEEFIDLQGKINAGKASVDDKVKFEEISGKIEEQTSKLAVDKKGNVVKNTKEDVRAVLTPEESSELVSLRAKANAEKLEGNDVNRLVELQEQADNAFKINESVSKTVLDSAKKGEAVTLDELENAVKFVERNGSVAETDKAQRILEKAVKANKDRVQKRIDAINKISKDTGIEYRFVDDANMHKIAQMNDKEYSPDSMYHGMAVNENGKPVVYINGDSNKSFYVTIGHETLHAIKSADETEYKNFAELITEYAEKNDPEFKEIIDKMKSNYKSKELDEEIIAELVGKHLFGETGEQLIKHIADTEPNIFKRLYNYIKKMFTGDDPELAKVVESFNKIYNETTSKNANNPLSAKLSKEVPVKDIPKQDKKVIIDKAFSEHTRYNNLDGYGLYYSTSANYSGMCTVKPDGSVEIVRAYDIRDAGKDRGEYYGIFEKPSGIDRRSIDLGNGQRTGVWSYANDGHRREGGQAFGLDGRKQGKVDTDSYIRRSDENRRRGKSYYSESEEYEKLIDSGKVKEARQMLDEKAKEYGFFRTKHDVTGEEVYLSLDGKHMKSADLVTYDSRNNPIELGDRFDSTIEDVRFSKEKKTSKPKDEKLSRNKRIEGVERKQIVKELKAKQSELGKKLVSEITKKNVDEFGFDVGHDVGKIVEIQTEIKRNDYELYYKINGGEKSFVDINTEFSYVEEADIPYSMSEYLSFSDEKREIVLRTAKEKIDQYEQILTKEAEGFWEGEDELLLNKTDDEGFVATSEWRKIKREGYSFGVGVKKDIDNVKDEKTFDSFLSSNDKYLYERITKDSKNKLDALGVEELWRRKRLESARSEAKYLTPAEATRTLERAQWLEDDINTWFLDERSRAKRGICNGIAEDNKLINACWNVMYHNYKKLGGTDSFEKFLDSEVTLYRGVHGQRVSENHIFSSYTLDRDVADNFIEGNNDYAEEVARINVKPKETFGSMSFGEQKQLNEAEVMIPRSTLLDAEVEGQFVRFSKEKKTPKLKEAKSEQKPKKPKLKSIEKMTREELEKELKDLKKRTAMLEYTSQDELTKKTIIENDKRISKAEIRRKELEIDDVYREIQDLYENDYSKYMPEEVEKINSLRERAYELASDIEEIKKKNKEKAIARRKVTISENKRKKLLKDAKVSGEDVRFIPEEKLKAEAKKLSFSIKYGRRNGSPKKITAVREERLRAVRNELDRREIESTPNYSYIEDFYANKKGNTIKEDAPKEHKPIMEKFKQAWGDTRRNWEDSLVGFETMAKKNKDNVMLNQTNDARNADKIAGGMITVGMTNADKRIVGKSLNEIFTKEIRTNKEMRNDFSNYLYHKVALDRYKLGKDVFGHTSEQKLKGFIDEIEKKYGKEKIEAFEKDVRDYIDNLNEYYVERGVVSRELMDNLKKDYPHYVPTNRVVELDDPLFSSGKVNYDAIDDGIKKAIGGDGAIEDLYKQMVGMTMSRVRSAEYNKLIEMYAKNSNIAVDELKKMSPKDLKESEVYMDVKKKADGAEYKLSYYSNGKQITIPVDRQTFLGYRDALGKGRNKLIDVLQSEGLRKAGTAFKAPITDLNVVFGIRNGMRDLQQAVVNSKNTRWFARSVFEGDYGRMLTDSNNPLRKIYDANGGKWSSLMNYDDLAKLGVEKEPKGVIKWIEQFNSSIESVPRMSEFAGTLKRHADTQLKKKGYKNGLGDIKKEIEAKYGDFNSQKAQYEYYNKILDECDANVISEAIRNANDITLNFGRNGKYGKAFNSGFVPYMNPSLQGLSKLIRMFSEADAKQLTSFVGKFALFTQAPAIVNEWTLRDNEAYQNLPTREKDNNFFIWLGNDRFLKIPKPRENAVLAEPIDYIYRAVLDKGQYGTMDEVKQMGKTALDNVGVTNPVTDNLFMPLVNTARNKDWKGMDIESQYDIDKFESKDRYDETTTDIAIKLGKTKLAQHYNLSPKKIDNLFDSYTGFVYDWSKPLLTKQGRAEASTSSNSTVGKVAKTASQPVTSQFIKDGVFSNKNSQKFWDKYTKLDKAQNAKDLTDKQRKKAEEKFKDFQNEYGAISTLNRAINDARSDKSISNEQVRAMRKELNKMYNKAVNGEPIDDNTVNIMAKSLGTRKALNNYLPDDDNVQYSWKEHYKDFKKDVGWKNLTKAERNKYAKHFLDVYNESVKTKKGFTNSYTDTPNYSVTGVVIADMQKNGKLSKKEAKKLMLATGVKEDSIKAFNEYAKNGGTPKTFAVTQKRVEKEVFDKDYEYLKYGVKNGTICMALATSDKVTYKDRAYQISNLDGDHVAEQTNSARGFASKYGHSTDDLQNLAKKCDSDKNGSLKRDEIISTVSKQKKFSDEEKAMAYVLLGGNPKTNPFGSIGDYSIKEDTGMNLNGDSSSGGGGHRHRRGRRYGGGGHGGGSGSGSKDWNSWLKSYVGTDASASTKSSAKSVKNNTSSSALNEAYRKRVRKLM